MQTIDTLFERNLRKIVNAEIDRLLEILSLGNMADYVEYKQMVGKIQGLRLALDYCEETNEIIAKG
jgi:hypothetical protein